MARGVALNFTLFGKDATASRAIRGVGGEADKAHGKFGRLGGIGKTAGLAIATGVGAAAAAVAVAVPLVVDMAKAAADDEAAQKRLALGLKNTTGATRAQIGAVEDWISKQGTALGVADDDLRPALQRLAQSTHDVTKAEQLASLAMDVSAGTGKSLASVSAALGKAYDGNVSGLARLGIKTKDAAGKALSFDQIQKNLAKTFGGQAKTAAGTFQGQMGRLNLMFREAKESAGSKLLPVLTKLGGWMLGTGVPALGKLGNQIMPKVRDMFAAVKRTIDENRPGLEKLGRIIGVVAGIVVTKVVPAFIKWEGLVLRGVVVALGKLGQVLPPIVAAFLRGAAQIVGAFRALTSAALTTMGGILRAAEKGLGWLPGIGPKIRAASAGFDRFKTDAVSKLRGVESGLLSAAGKVDDFGRKAKSIPEAKLKADISNLTDKLATAKKKLMDPSLTKERRAELKATIAQLEREVNRAKSKLASVKGKTVPITLKVTTLGGRQGIRGADGRWTPISKIQPFAEGGLVKGGRGGVLGLIGEGQHDELVIPLGKGGAGIGGNVYVYLTVSGGLDSAETIGRRTRDALLTLKRNTGVDLGLA